MEKEIIINNKLNETGRISQFMEELGVSLNIPSEIAMSMNLAIEEIIANIIQYAYPKGESSEIQLQAHITPGRLTFQITDEGIAVDPFQKKSPDEKPSLEEQLTKGLGPFPYSPHNGRSKLPNYGHPKSADSSETVGYRL